MCHAIRYLEVKRPKSVALENVVNLVFELTELFCTIIQWPRELKDENSECLYNNHWRALNTEDTGLQQHRERVYIVGLRRGCDVRAVVVACQRAQGEELGRAAGCGLCPPAQR